MLRVLCLCIRLCTLIGLEADEGALSRRSQTPTTMFSALSIASVWTKQSALRYHRQNSAHVSNVHLCVNLSMYMYIRLHACTYTIHRIQTHICIYSHTTQRLDAPEHTHMDNDSMCLHACIYISTCMYVDTCMCILTYAYAPACMYIGHMFSVYVLLYMCRFLYIHGCMDIYMSTGCT